VKRTDWKRTDWRRRDTRIAIAAVLGALAACSHPAPLAATRVLALTKLSENLHAVAVFPDASAFVTADLMGELCARELPSGKERWRVRVHPRGAFAIDTVAISPDAALVAIAGDQYASIEMRDTVTGMPLWDVPLEKTRALAFHPSEEFLVACAGGSLNVVDLRSREVARVVQSAHMEDGLTAAAFSADGRFLATGSEHGLVKVWTWPDLAARATMTMESARREPQFAVSVALARDGARCAANAIDGDLHVWDLPPGEPATPETLDARRFAGTATAPGDWHVEMRRSLGFCADGRWLVAPSEHDRGLRVVDARSGEAHVIATGSGPFCKGVALAPDLGLVVAIHPAILTGAGPDGIEAWKLAPPGR
jgi:WD40 repeat protein